MQISESRLERYLAILMMVASLIILWITLAHPIVDGDIWFHMLYGKVMVEQGSLIVDHTQFSWTSASNASVYCAWIAQIFYYYLYTIFGDTGVILFRYLAVTIPFVALMHLAWQRNVFWQALPWFAATISILSLYPSSFDKPELFSLIFMTLLVWNWYQTRQLGKQVLYNVYCFPFIILLWVNSHGIFVFGCIFLFFVGIGETCNQIFYRHHALPRKVYINLMVSFALSALAIFINPYGVGLIENIVHTNLAGTNEADLAQIRAWVSTFDAENKWLVIFANTAVVTVVFVLFTALKKRKIDIVPVLVNIVFAYFFTKYMRLTYLWVPIFLLTVVFYAKEIVPDSQKLRRFYFYGVTTLTCFTLGWIFYSNMQRSSAGNWPDLGESEFYSIPTEVDYIEEHYKDARIGNVYEHGAYILWRRWPQQKVMIDARQFPYNSLNRDYWNFVHANDMDSFLKKYPFNLAVISHKTIDLMDWFAHSNMWQPVFYGPGAALYVKGKELGNEQRQKVERAKALTQINDFEVAVYVLHTALSLRDWQGYDMLLTNMQNRFSSSKKKIQMKGFAELKMAMQAYDEGKFSRAIEFFDMAKDKNAGYSPGLSAAAVSQSLLDWNEGRYVDAKRNAMRAVFAQNKSFPAIYNLAVMAWQAEQRNIDGKHIDLALSPEEREILSRWRNALQELIKDKNVPKRYEKAHINAMLILSEDEKAQVLFLPADEI